MADAFDWRARDSARFFAAHGRAAFAWEFLRRNPAYWKERARLLARIGSGTLRRARMDTLLARRWGVIAAPDPDTADPHQVLWRVDLDPACIPLVPALRRARLTGAFRLDASRLPCRWSGPIGRYHASADGRVRLWLPYRGQDRPLGLCCCRSIRPCQQGCRRRCNWLRIPMLCAAVPIIACPPFNAGDS